ncbi:MAG TPA: spore germination protein GerW family protein [Solirubrobacteraceae bacterium]|jgi:uncharacterized spore protein YtfJ|nr:spore germination protein GerW family protein [Solirubrobacteraceae bacterium]
MSKPARGRGASTAVTLRRLSARLSGARLCYGKPVRAGDHTIIPVASVRVAGGGGFGRAGGGERGDGDGGGGGGALAATPVGFIDVGPEGARYQRIDGGSAALRRAAASAVLLVVARSALRRGARRGLRRAVLDPAQPGQPRLQRGR